MGQFGTIAYVDLTSRSVKVVPIPEEVRRLYLGGRGINVYLLYNHLGQGVDALSPDNVLIFGAGLLTGTAAPSPSRFNVSAKSPLTGFLGDANSGGFWSSELRFAGFDHLVIEGRAVEPTYLWITDGQIEFRDASHLWGLDTMETQQRIKTELDSPEVQVVCIGQAGENMVRFACIIHGAKNAAGRTGMGAVMGSKNLKAVAVKGSTGVKVRSPQRLLELRQELQEKVGSSRVLGILGTYGTSYLLDAHQRLGCLPVRNNQQNATEDEAWKNIGMESMKRHSIKMSACFGCSIHCRHGYRVPFGQHKGAYAEGPEYISIAHLGADTGTFDIETVLVAQDLCNRYGMDTLSGGAIIAWAMELYQRGIIDRELTGGLALEWGNGQALIELIDRIAYRKDFGAILAEDGLRASSKIGGNSADYFMHVKGQAVCTDERGLMGCALNLATASRGADHLRSRPIPEGMLLQADFLRELYGGPVSPDPRSYEGKALMVTETEKRLAIPDLLGTCKLLTKGFLSPRTLDYTDYADLANAVAGLDLTPQQLEECGERVVNLERLFNLGQGLTREHDTLPRRYFEEETPKLGIVGGNRIDKGKFDQMLDEYYELHGWNRKGVPSDETLRRLRLEGEPSHLV